MVRSGNGRTADFKRLSSGNNIYKEGKDVTSFILRKKSIMPFKLNNKTPQAKPGVSPCPSRPKRNTDYILPQI